MAGPLSHIRVLDLSGIMAGPWASQVGSLTTVCGSRSRWKAARYGRTTAPRRAGPGPIPKARAILRAIVPVPRRRS